MVPARPAPAPLLKPRRHVWGLLAMALLAGAIVALVWTSKAHPGADLLGYPYPGVATEGDQSRHRLLLSVFAMLAVGGLFGVVAWLADLQSAQMSRSSRRRFKREVGAPDHGVG